MDQPVHKDMALPQEQDPPEHREQTARPEHLGPAAGSVRRQRRPGLV